MLKANLLKVYAVYCSNQPRILQAMKDFCSKYPAFNKLVKDNFGKETRFLGLEDFLIMPMQRLTKYPLLLRSLRDAMPDNKEKELLSDVLTKITNIVLLINERTRKVENVQALAQVKSKIVNGDDHNIVTEDRIFLYEGKVKVKRQTFSILKNVSIDDSYGFLFNDKLLLCMKDENSAKYVVKSTISFENAYEFKFETPDINNILLTIYSTNNDKDIEKKYKLKTLTEKDRDTWLNKLKIIQNQYLKRKKEAPSNKEFEDSIKDSQSSSNHKLNKNSSKHSKNDIESSSEDNKKNKSKSKNDEIFKRSESLKTLSSHSALRKKKRSSTYKYLPTNFTNEVDMSQLINDLYVLSNAFVDVISSVNEFKETLNEEQKEKLKLLLFKKKFIKKGIKLINENKTNLGSKEKEELKEMNMFIKDYKSIPDF